MRGVKSVSRLIFPTWKSNCFSTICGERLSFLHCIAFAPVSKMCWLCLCGSASGLSVLLHWCVRLVFCQHHPVLITGVYRKSQNQVVSVPNFVLAHCHVGYSGSVASPWKLQYPFVNTHKITWLDFDWGCTESIHQSEKNWHLNNIGSFYLLNVECFSLDLDPWFLSSEHHSFPHVDLAHTLLNLYLYISLFRANINDICFNWKCQLFMAGIQESRRLLHMNLVSCNLAVIAY